MRNFSIFMALFCAIVGVGTLEDCQGYCAPAEEEATIRMIIALVALAGTAFFTYCTFILPEKD